MATEKLLIDANELSLGKFLEPRTEWHQGWNDALDAAKEAAPTVDAVEAVRCKDCFNYHKKIGMGFGKCSKTALMPYPDDFCSYGERRNDGP